MKQSTASTGLSIKIITSLVLLLIVGLLAGTFFTPGLFWAGLFVAIITLGCYLSAPVAYELRNGQLLIFSRVSRKMFGPVIGCSSVDKKPSIGIRLWGNGGLFAGTGIFWCREYGIFRAYVTRGKMADLVLVETPSTKVLITPENSKEFIRSAGLTHSPV